MATINSNIKGYEYVKNVKACGGYEHCGYDLVFVVRRDCGNNYLKGLVEVCENKGYEQAKTLQAKYPFENYIIWKGEVATLPKGSYILPEGGDIIRFYWS